MSLGSLVEWMTVLPGGMLGLKFDFVRLEPIAITTSALAMNSVNIFERERVEPPSASGCAVRDRALAGIGRDDRRGDELGERGEQIAGLGVVDALARPQHRVLGGEQHARRFLDRVRIGRGALHRHRDVVDLALELGLEDLVRHLDHHRARLAASAAPDRRAASGRAAPARCAPAPTIWSPAGRRRRRGTSASHTASTAAARPGSSASARSRCRPARRRGTRSRCRGRPARRTRRSSCRA